MGAAQYTEALNEGILRERLRRDSEVQENLGIEFAYLLGGERELGPVRARYRDGDGDTEAPRHTIRPPTWKSDLRELRRP